MCMVLGNAARRVWGKLVLYFLIQSQPGTPPRVCGENFARCFSTVTAMRYTPTCGGKLIVSLFRDSHGTPPRGGENGVLMRDRARPELTVHPHAVRGKRPLCILHTIDLYGTPPRVGENV